MKHLLLLSVVTGILLTLSFPGTGWGILAWVALVPLLIAIRDLKSGLHALGLGYLAGLVFFLLSMHWLTHVSAAGWFLVALVEAPYFMVFAWLVYLGQKAQWPPAYKILWTASAWTLAEFVRSEMPVFGLGWNLLAYSQAAAPAVIQVANAIGAYGLGFLMVVVNACAAELILPEKKKKRGIAAILFSVILLALAGVYAYGERSLSEEKKPGEYLRVSVLQGNIPQSVKWAPVAKGKTVEIYSKLTELASLDQADLVIWPEAAFPGYFNRDVQGESVKQLARSLGVPLLVGGLYWDDESNAFNSAYFLDKNGVTTQRYDKLKLVPFGEYVPLKPLFFWLAPVADALGIGDFSEGEDAVIFRWAREEWPFGALICFEDVLPKLARDLADRGAKFMTVITNDAWFGKTGAPFQHLQASIFRAVENGIPVVRSANTGVSGVISYRGEVLTTVKGAKGEETFVAGRATYDLPLLTKDTWYRKGGWMFPYFILAIFVSLLAIMMRRVVHEAE